MELSKEFKEMNCNETRERINESFDVDFQLNLPQYLDDIDTLVKCCVKNVVADYDLSSSSIIIYGKGKIMGVFGKSEDIVIPWSDIDVIGEDTILVNCECPVPKR